MKNKLSKTAKTNSLTEGDLDKIAGLLDRQFDSRFKPFVKEEIIGVEDKISGLESSLKVYIHEGVETIMAGIDNIAEHLAEKDKVERIAKAVKEIGDKVGVKVNI